jgi:serine/threonine protein kinase/Flp pilus assembly protein TadD
MGDAIGVIQTVIVCEQFMNEETLFAEALGKQGEARATFLDEHCKGDIELRKLLEALLRANDNPNPFLDAPAPAGGATIDKPVREAVGAVIGPYKLLQQIGEGGMGVVWMAEQTQPVQRKVALKVIKPGMDSRQVIARFEAERQALAMMDHVSIARVFDGGTTENGRPYFVMELVHGMPITKYCDDNHLTPRERLELFVPVCQAIQHAHQKGIIHRDIKPSNVLVTLYDGKPVPKVIDFGVAKATEQKLTERTLFTQYGAMVGTLEYMSPEQAEMSALGVDTRSDIYSLGVLLYELLTGNTPLTHKRMKEAAYAEILRMIKEEEPQKPSTRLSDSGEALASISANRHMEPAKLTKLVRGELDWIVMKTLEKDRNRRYETASAFAMDVQRYLVDEPVQACPPSAWYRVRKFARRNKVALVIIASVAVALLSGTGISTWQAVRATKAEELAEKRLVAERDARSEAETNFRRAHKAVHRMLTRVAEERLIDVPWMEPVRKTLLEDAIQFYEQLLAERNTDSEIRLATAWAHMKLGWVNGRFSETDKQQAAYRRALDLLEPLVKEYPNELTFRAALARGLHLQSHSTAWSGKRWKEAEQLLRRAVDLQQSVVSATPDSAQEAFELATMLHLLGNALFSGSQAEQAEAVWRQAMTVSERITAKEPHHPAHLRVQIRALTTISSIYRKKDPPQAEALLQRAQVLAARFQALPATVRAAMVDSSSFAIAGVDLSLGDLYKDQGRHGDAETAYRRGIAILDKYAADFPGMPFYRAQLVGALGTLGWFLLADRRPAEAEAILRRAWQLDEGLLRERTTQSVAHDEWHLGTLSGLGRALREQGRPQEALQLYQQAAKLLDEIQAAFPNQPHGWPRLAESYRILADSLTGADTGDQAEQAYGQAIRIYGKLVADFADRPADRFGLAQSYRGLGNRLGSVNRLDEAEKTYRQALEVLLKLTEEIPADINYRYGAAWTCDQLGSLLARTKRPEEAEKRYRQALKFFQTVAADRPTAPQYRSNIAHIYGRLGSLFWDNGKFKEAAEVARQSLAVFDKLVTDCPDQPAYRQALANTYQWQLVRLAVAANRPKEAEKARRQALAIWEKLAADFPRESQYWHKSGVLQHALAQHNDAVTSLTRAVELQPDLWESWHWRGLSFASLGQWDKAVADQTRALTLKPDHSWSWHQRGVGYSRLAQWEKAIADHSKAIELKPDYWEAYHASGLPLGKLGQWDKAIANQTKALELNPKHWWLWSRRGEGYSALKEWDKAVADYTKAIELGAADPYVWLSKAAAHAQLNQPDKAMTDLRQAVGKGLRDVKQLKNRSDWDGLRSREDFKKLVAELEAKKK